MKLSIDTSKSETISVCFDDILPALKGGVSPRRMTYQSSIHPRPEGRGFLERCYKERYEIEAKKDKSQRLMPFIYEILKEKKLSLKDITEIEIETGPGSFTGLRVGVSVANALGWALGIPVDGKNIRKGETVEIKYS